MPQIYGSLHKPSRTMSWQFLRTFLVFFFWLAALGLIIYTAFYSNAFSVKNVQVQGVHFNSPDTIRQIVPQHVNIWRLPTASIEKQILALPAVDSVQVLRDLPDTVRVVVTEKQPLVLWSSAGTASLLDASGTVFAQYPMSALPAKGTPIGDLVAKDPVVIDSQNLAVQLHHPVVGSTFITFVNTAQAQLATLLPELTIDHFEVGTTTYDLTLFAKQGMQVQFNTLGDPAVEIRNLTRLVRQEHVKLTQHVNLEIDRWAYVQ